MLAGKNKELQKILHLIRNNKINDAKEKLAEFEKKNHKSVTNLRAQIINSLLSAYMGSWKQGLESIDSTILECKTIDNPLLLLDAFQVKARCLAIGEQYKKAIALIEEIEILLEEKLKPDEEDYLIRKAWLLMFKGSYFGMMGDGKRSLEIAKLGFPIANSLNDTEILIQYYDLLGIAKFHMHEYEESITTWQNALQKAKDSKNEYWTHMFFGRLMESYYITGKSDLALKYNDYLIEYNEKQGLDTNWFIYYRAWIYWSMGEIEKTIEMIKGVLPSLENLPSLIARGWILTGKAILVWWDKGDLDKAIEYLQEAISLMKKRDDVHRTNRVSVVLARAFFGKGKFDKVLEICFSILDTYKESNMDTSKSHHVHEVYYEMGKTYQVKGDYNLALEYVQKAQKLFKKNNNIFWIARSFFSLIQIAIDKNDEVLYSKYLKEFEAFVKENPTNFVKNMFKTTQALVLKASTRPRDWAKAVNFLIEIVSVKFTKQDYSLVALINLCELLMNEFSISGDAQVLQELEFYVEELSEQAKMQNVRHLRLEANNLQILTHWLKAQRSMVDLDFQKAKTLLNSARKIADEEGLFRLAEKLTQQQEKLLGQLSQWDDFIRKYYEFIKE